MRAVWMGIWAEMRRAAHEESGEAPEDEEVVQPSGKVLCVGPLRRWRGAIHRQEARGSVRRRRRGAGVRA